MNPQNKVVTSNIMVKSAFLNQNEDFLKNASKQHTKLTEMYSENKYSNVEENNNSLNVANLSSTHLNNKEMSVDSVLNNKDTLLNDREIDFDELLGMRYKANFNETLDTHKTNEVLLDSLDTFSQNNTTHLNELSSNNFNDSLDYINNFKVYNKGNEEFFKGFFNDNVSSNTSYNQFQKNDKLDTKEVQLDNLVTTAPYTSGENLDKNLDSNLNTKLLDMGGMRRSLDNKDPLTSMYNMFNMNDNVFGESSYYEYQNTNNDNNNYNNSRVLASNYYTNNESGYAGYDDDLIGFTEFEKGLVSMCEEASTKQGSSILSSPEQLNNATDASQKTYTHSKANFNTSNNQYNQNNNTNNNQNTQNNTSSKDQNSVSGNALANSSKDNTSGKDNTSMASFDADSLNAAQCKADGSGRFFERNANKKDFYSASTSFGESCSYSCDSLYKMDSLAQSLVYDSEYPKGYFQKGSYSPYSPAGNQYGGNKGLSETSFSGDNEPYKSYLSLNSNASSNFFNYFRDEKREDDTTPFTHVVSSVATVADTVTPLCSSDLNTEFAETVQVLLERYLVGDLSVESELYSLFLTEFNLENSEVYNSIVKYCTNKNLLYYSYKLLLQSTHLLESCNNANYNSNFANKGFATREKSVTVEVYTQTLLSLLTTQDSTHLSRSLFGNLTVYSNAANCNLGQNSLNYSAGTHGNPVTHNLNANFNMNLNTNTNLGNTSNNTNNTSGLGFQVGSNSQANTLTKEADKVLRMYAFNITMMTRGDPVVFERFLNILEDHQGRLEPKLACLLLAYVLQVDLAGRPQFESWMSLSQPDAVCYLLKLFRMSLFARLSINVRFTLHFLELMMNPSYSVEFVENSKLLLLFLDYAATNFPLSYNVVVLKLLEKRLFNSLLFFNALQLALKCDYGSMVTKICLSALQSLKGVVPIEFTTPTFGKFEFVTLENVNKLVILLSGAGNGTAAGNPAVSNPSSASLLSNSGKDFNQYLHSVGNSDKNSKDLGCTFSNVGLGNSEVSQELSLVNNLLDICKVLFSYNSKELFVPLVECCVLVEDFQGCECIMKYYCDYYGMVSEMICEKVLLSIALKGNFNYVNRLLKGTQSYESCEVFLTHTNSNNLGNTSSNTNTSNDSNKDSTSKDNNQNNASGNAVANSSNSANKGGPNGLIRLSVYLVRICISILNFNVAINYVKPLLRLNQQNEEISNTLMIVATRLDSRSKLDSFLSFCERTSILINEACFNVILDSCIKLKNNKRLLRIISKFRMWGLYPNIQTFGVIIKSLSCCSMIQECEELFYNYLTYTTYSGGSNQLPNPTSTTTTNNTDSNTKDASSKDSSSGNASSGVDGLVDQRNGDSGSPNNSVNTPSSIASRSTTMGLSALGSNSSDNSDNSNNTSSQNNLGNTNNNNTNSNQNSNQNNQNNTSSKDQQNKEGNVRINEIIYGCMFDAYVNNNKVDNAMRLFEDMKVRGQVKPNTIMYTTLIKGYGQNKQLDKAMKIFKMMQQDRVVPNTVTYNSIIDACARVGDMSGATSLLEDMLMNNIEPDLITFSTIIKGYCVQSDMDKSFQLLSIMYERGIMPDVILYNSLLEGCVKSGLLWLCEKLWKQMQDYNIPPSNFTLTILIKMYGRSGQLDKVFELADELPKRYNFSINTHVYTCLMSACITNGKYAMVLDIYKFMKKNGVRPDAKTFETIIQGLSKGALFREAAQVVMEVYSLTNCNNGEAQISNINSKVLERLFQRFYMQHCPSNQGTQLYGGNNLGQNGSNYQSKDLTQNALANSSKDKNKNKPNKEEFLFNVAVANSYNNSNPNSPMNNGDDYDELGKRRKKTAVKAATLLIKNDVVSEEEEPEVNQDEDQEVLSDQDNEWKVSSDESDETRQFSSYGPNVSKIIQAVENGVNNETSKDGNENKGHTIWAKEELENKEEEEEVQVKPKIWVPKFKESKTLLPSRDDVGLAESVKMFESKNDNTLVKKKKKNKGKSLQEYDEDDDFVRIKFDVFSLLDTKYSVFKSENHKMNEDLVKSKYNGRKLTLITTK